MIQVHGISKQFGNNLAVKDVTFCVKENQILGLLGENGAGKTTLLNMISGYIEPDEGTVQIEGMDIQAQPYQAKRRLGYLPEEPPLYLEMTVEEYLSFCIELKEVVKKDRKKHLKEILDITNIADVRHRKIGNLSHGYKQRIGLAQALCGNPEVLLLDEPTNGLDPSQIVDFRRMIEKLSKTHTIVLSSHVLSLVQSMCERILILHKGKLVADRNLANNAKGCFSLALACSSKGILSGLRELPSVERVSLHPAQGAKETHVTVETNAADRFPHELSSFVSGRQIAILELKRQQDTLEEIYMQALRASGGEAQ